MAESDVGRPRLVLIADVGTRGPGVVDEAIAIVAAAAESGVADRIRLIDRDTSGTADRVRYARLRRLRAATEAAGVELVVSARADLAWAVGANGVQLPERGLPVGVVKAAFPSLMIGRSCHDRDGVLAAVAAGCDWVLLAPFAVPHSKPPNPTGGPALGVSGFAAIVRGLACPIYALGGVVPEDMSRVIAAGGAGLATIGGVFGRADPVGAMRAFLVGPG